MSIPGYQSVDNYMSRIEYSMREEMSSIGQDAEKAAAASKLAILFDRCVPSVGGQGDNSKEIELLESSSDEYQANIYFMLSGQIAIDFNEQASAGDEGMSAEDEEMNNPKKRSIENNQSADSEQIIKKRRTVNKKKETQIKDSDQLRLRKAKANQKFKQKKKDELIALERDHRKFQEINEKLQGVLKLYSQFRSNFEIPAPVVIEELENLKETYSDYSRAMSNVAEIKQGGIPEDENGRSSNVDLKRIKEKIRQKALREKTKQKVIILKDIQNLFNRLKESSKKLIEIIDNEMSIRSFSNEFYIIKLNELRGLVQN